ncbi:MAG: hypothetical protein LUD68_00230 [Rikenellaceae bacterium]|nr:hypothetical protein [Rikenellaceae bacterium]
MIENVNIASAADGDQVGLFSKIQGDATVANVNLQHVTIASTGDNSYVGGLVGRLNTPMTEEEKQSLIDNLPDGLSPVVREALIQEILAAAGNSTASVVACKVTDVSITVAGQDPIVGGLVGQAGVKDDEGDAWSRIWDSAVVGGSIRVNDGNPDANENAYVGGFVGLNEGYITRSYTTIDSITAERSTTDAQGTPTTESIAEGFGTQGLDFLRDEGGLIESSFCVLPDLNNGVELFGTDWPAWNTYTGIWSVEILGWLSDPSSTFWYENGYAPDTYPVLQWERR